MFIYVDAKKVVHCTSFYTSFCKFKTESHAKINMYIIYEGIILQLRYFHKLKDIMIIVDDQKVKCRSSSIGPQAPTRSPRMLV